MITLNAAKFRQPIKPTGNTWTISGTQNNLNVLSVPYYGLYAPSCLWHDGATYLAHRKSHVTSDGTAGIIKYYNGDISQQFMASSPGSLDYHDNPVLGILDNGTVILMHEQHARDLCEVWKMTTPGHITSFQKQDDSAQIGDYPKVYKKQDDTFFVIGRKTNAYDLYITTYDGSTWGTPLKMTDVEVESGSNDNRHYPFYVCNFDGDGKHYLKFSKRVTISGVINYLYIYFAWCHDDDIYTWHNADGSFSKKVNTDGHLTESELNTHFRYSTNNTATAGGGGFGFVQDGIYRQYNAIGTEFSVDIFDGSWSNVAINYDEFESRRMIVKDRALFITIGKDGNNVSVHNSNLTDIDFKYLAATNENGIFNVIAPYNFHEIPKGEKFAVFAGTLKNGDTDVADSSVENDIIVIEMIK